MEKKISLLIFITCINIACLFSKSVYVSVIGNDTNSGTVNAPFKSIKHALKALNDGDEVILLDGLYVLDEPVYLYDKSNIQIKAQNVGGAVLTSSVHLSLGDFRKVSDKKIYKRLNSDIKKYIKELDLSQYGIQIPKFKDLFNVRENFPEIFLGDKRVPFSKYPNEGYMTMGKVIDNFGNSEHGGIFTYKDERHKNWINAIDEGLWMTGFWRIPWQSNTVRISSIDVKNKTVTHSVGIGVSKNPKSNGSNNGIGSKYDRPDGSGEEPYFVINLPEELDVPGEWCVDFERQKIYMYIPSGFAEKGFDFTSYYFPLLVLKNTSKVTIEGIIFQKSANTGVEIIGGNDNKVIGCTFKDLNGTAVILDGGVNHKILSCDFYSLGKEGVIAMGGDRKTLTPCNFLIENNYFSNFGIVKDSWAPAVRLGRYEPSGSDKAGEDAVGIKVRHNLVHDAPHSAFLYVGNLNLFEYNEVFDIAKKTGDVGAFYSRHDWTSRGNVLRNNFIHHIPRANGTYHDDGHTGDSVYNNIIHGASVGTLIGGGHDNVVTNNVYIDCFKRGVSIDSRGKHRNYTIKNKNYTYRFREYDLCGSNWLKIYPEMCNWINQERLDLPHNDIIENNSFINCASGIFLSGSKDDFKYSPRLSGGKSFSVNDNIIEKLLITGEDVLKPYLTEDFNIDYDNIGLYNDSYRTKLPDVKSLLKGVSGNRGFDSSKDIDASNKK